MIKTYLNQLKDFASDKMEEVKNHPLTEATADFVLKVKNDLKNSIEEYKKLSAEKVEEADIEYNKYDFIDKDLVQSLPHSVYLELEKECQKLPYRMSVVEYLRLCKFCFDNKEGFVETENRSYIQNPDIEIRTDHASGIGRGLTVINKKTKVAADITDYSAW